VGEGLLEWGGSINRRVAEAQRETQREGNIWGEEKSGEERRGEVFTTETQRAQRGRGEGNYLWGEEEKRGEEKRGGEGGGDPWMAEGTSLRLTERGFFLTDLVLGELV